MKTTRNPKVWALIVLGSSALMGGMTTAASAGSDFRISFNNSSSSYSHTSTAGILVVDGQQFTIYSSRNIGDQIVRILRRCGYDASIDCGNVVICYDRRRAPNVCWYQRGYSATISQSRGTMRIAWCKVPSVGHSISTGGWGWSSGHHWRNTRICPPAPRRGWDRGHDGRRGDGHRGGNRGGHRGDHRGNRGGNSRGGHRSR